MTKTSSSGFPFASLAVQPVISSATAFMNVTCPAASVAITASPMLLSVVENHSLDSACLLARLRNALLSKANGFVTSLTW